MVTFLAIVVLIVVIVGVACMTNALVNGCPFAWVWFLCGGMEGMGTLVGACLEAIASGFSE